MGIEAVQFRRALGRFGAGISVVTLPARPFAHGITVNALCSVSLDPPLLLICVDRSARAHDLIPSAGVWAVNLLSATQRPLSDHFARTWTGEADPFEGIPHEIGALGAPLLEGCLARAECRLVRTLDGGDHSIYVGEVVDGNVTADGAPLIYFASRYRTLRARSYEGDPFRSR